jgi:hypothetical protein
MNHDKYKLTKELFYFVFNVQYSFNTVDMNSQLKQSYAIFSCNAIPFLAFEINLGIIKTSFDKMKFKTD